MKFRTYSGIQSNRGQSLVSTLVGLAISGIVLAIMLHLMSEQNKSLKYFEQKSDAIEMKLQLAQALANPQACTWQVTGLGQKFDSSNPASQVFNLNQVYSGNSNASLVIAQVGGKVSRYPDFTVSKIQMKDFASAGGGRYTGVLEVGFNQPPSDRAIAPIRVRHSIAVNTADPVNAQTILGCSNTPEEEGESCNIQQVLLPSRLNAILATYNFQNQWQSLWRSVGYTALADLMSTAMKAKLDMDSTKYGLFVPALKNRQIITSKNFPSGQWTGESNADYQKRWFLTQSPWGTSYGLSSNEDYAGKDIVIQCVNGKSMWITDIKIPPPTPTPPPESGGD